MAVKHLLAKRDKRCSCVHLKLINGCSKTQDDNNCAKVIAQKPIIAILLLFVKNVEFGVNWLLCCVCGLRHVSRIFRPFPLTHKF